MDEMFPKDSLDRFSDDMCELLLSYLSLEDKCRFECLSKQWQRVVFESQTVFTIDDNFRRLLPKKSLNAFQSLLQSLKTRIESTFGHKFAKSEYNWTLFETIVKKCPNITSVVLPHKWGLEDKAIELLIKHCPQFKGIVDDFVDVSDGMSDQFITIFGPQLLLIKPLVSFSAKQLQTSTQLETIYLHFERKLFSAANVLTETQHTFKRLKCVLIVIKTNDMDNHLEALTAFVGRYGTQLKGFVILLTHMVDIEATLNAFVPIIGQMSALIDLQIRSTLCLHNETLIPILQTIGITCRRLKRLVIDIAFLSSDAMAIIAKTFPGLTRLSMTGVSVPEGPMICQSLQALKRLTHLDLHIYYGNPLKLYFTDSFFANIGHILPNLQYLKVSVVKITDKSFISLYGLRQIRGITLTGDTEGWEQDISEMSVNLYESCPKLSFIHLKTDLFDD